EAGGVRLGGVVASGSPSEIRVSGLRHFGRYHKAKAVWGRGGACVLEDPRLALYYANRLDGLSLPAPLPAFQGASE
ncbi:MAG: hypothetical protein VX498_07755, partial [Myxococcota bacterium]|nr:hypothetical protein [Myxococcota bacterium]